MDENQDPNEIADIQLNEQEEDFIGQCWDGVQESGKLSLSGLAALTETLGITMDTINVAVTGLGGDDCTMNVDEFMVLMGRLVRSGALQLPGDRDLKGGEGGSSTAEGNEEVDTADTEEMANIQLSEAEEVFIGQCWDGVAEDGKISMQGLNALCDTLGITMDTINLAVTNLGDEDCKMGIDDFMVLMGRLVRSGAVAMPGTPAAVTPQGARTAAPAPGQSGWLNAMVAEEESPAAKKTAAPTGGSWMSAMTAGEEEEEEETTAEKGAPAWMASMTAGEQDEDEDEEQAVGPASAGGAGWLSAMGGGDSNAPAGKTASSGPAAWMASMAVGEDDEDDEDAVPAGASKPATGGANAWLSSMTADDDGSP